MRVFASSTLITVAADKTEADPGDVIEFSIIMGPVSAMGSLQMVIVIPAGLSYVEGSGQLADGLRETLGFDYIAFTDVSVMVNGGASRGDYSSEVNTLICTFQCTVNEGFRGTAEVGLTELEFYSVETWKDHTSEYSVKPAIITIAGGETEAESTEGTSPANTTEADTKPGESTESGTKPAATSEAETSEVRPNESETDSVTSAESTENSEAGPKETTKEQTGPTQGSRSTEGSKNTDPTVPPASQNSSEATRSGEDATEEATEGENTETEEGSEAPKDTEMATDSKEAAVTTEEQGSEGTEKASSEADTKDNTDKTGTKPAESDKDKNDPDSDKDSTRKGGWIWLAAVVMAIIAGTFFVIFLSRRKNAKNAKERGRSRKKVK